jgi:Pro-kumamolisin, activation domain/Bacterial Ig-like domain (group 3)
MKLRSSVVRTSVLLSLPLLFVEAPRVAAQSNAQPASQSSFVQTRAVPARITQAIDETQLVRLKGNVHPLARPEFDQGSVPDSTPMSRMLLVLERSAEQEAALQTLLGEQQAKDSPNYHNWLTPQQFGAQFGPGDADIQTVTTWLAQHGFQGIKVAAGRTVIEFSGTAGQVRNAFHSAIHHYLVNGTSRQANSTDPQIPAALTPVVAGIATLHNFPRKSMKRDVGAFVQTKDGIVKPQFTGPPNCGTTGNPACFYVVGPADFAKIYNLPNGLNGTPTTLLDGTGVTIAIVADSNINPQDVIDFRALFGLPATFTSANVILDGPDPGLNADEDEADLDTQVAGMVAPGATINLVVSEDTLAGAGIDLSALYIIDNNIAPVMSESFGVCEPALGTGGNQFYNAIWEQAAAQGLSVMVSAGDNGSAGCDDFTTATTATLGLAVSGIASTPFNVAVGGTDFDDAGKQTSFWNPSTGNATGTRESALGYIPETTWNDSCATAATNANLNTVCANPTPASLLNIVGGSGGPSTCSTLSATGTCVSGYAKPAWQNGVTPADNHRDLPDVSLFASDGQSSNSFYLFCQADALLAGSPPSCASSGAFGFEGAGGTSASSPAFAAIMALINQQSGRQGNPNPILYTIAKTPGNLCNSSTQPLSPPATCVFYDITKGNDSVPCSGGTLNCSSTTSGTNGVLVSPSSTTTPAWTSGTGYDTATGLGSVNVTNLAAAWKTAVGALKTSSTSLSVTPTSITHGSSVTAAVTVSAPAGGTPTGDVALLAPTSVNGGVSDGTLSTTGTVSISTTFLPGGSYNVTAHYAGDGTFAPSDSAGIPVTVTPENSSVLAEMVDTSGNITTSFPYGSGPLLRMDVLNHMGNSTNCQPLVLNGAFSGCALDATGSVTITDNGTALPESPVKINSNGNAEDKIIQLSGGSHALVLNYAGDISYNAAPAVNLAVTVTPASTTASISASPTTVPTNQQVTLSVTIGSQSNSTQGPTGTVTFKDGSTSIGTANVAPAGATAAAGASGTASLSTTFATSATHSITAVYGGDTNYTGSTSPVLSLAVGQTTMTAVTSSSTSISSGGSVTLTATVVATGTGANPTGTVQFMNGTTALSMPQTCAAVSGATSPTCSATLMTTLAFLAPPAGPNRIPTIRGVPWLLPAGLVLLVLLLLGLQRVPRAYRRAYACASLLLLAGLVAGLATGCGSSYGGGGGGGPHYDSITAVYSGDATYAGSTSPVITITVQ